ncbi:hypothetical protein Dimus_006954 [Dionaea muscipula]
MENSGAFRRRNSLSPKKEIPAKSYVPRGRTPTTAGNGNHWSSSSPPPSSSSYGVDFELVSLKSTAYVSLKDIIPSSHSILSPSAAAVSPLPTAASTLASSGGTSVSGYEISIRNRLVKQAAWAYLQPMSTSPSSSGRRHWSLFSGDAFKNLVLSFGRWIVDAARRVCRWLEDALWFILCR